jgi:type VI secretion system secreted protein VgrG
MKRIATIGLGAVMAVLLAGTALAAASVNLGTAKSFAVLAGTTITNTGSTTITGDVGLYPGDAVTGFANVTLHGAQHIGDAVALDAKNALVTAYNDAAGATPVTKVATELGGTTVKPGVYGSDTLGLTGTLTLDGEGLYVFQAASTLITAPNSSVELINGASACNVYWQVGSSATLGTSTKFKGTIMALTSIALNKGVTLQGRALARNGAVTMNNDTIDSSSCAAPSPTASPSATPTASPSATPTASPSATPTASPSATPTPGATSRPTVTTPPTDTLASTPGAVTDPVSVTFLVLMFIIAIALVGSLRFAAIRSRPRD